MGNYFEVRVRRVRGGIRWGAEVKEQESVAVE
jgi:hypothetical protein